MLNSNRRYEAIIYVRVAIEESPANPYRFSFDGYKITAPRGDYKSFVEQIERLSKMAKPLAIIVPAGWTIDKV